MSVLSCPDQAWRVDGHRGSFGFITSMSEHFCASCKSADSRAAVLARIELRRVAPIGRQHGLRLGPDTHRPASCTSDVAHMHARGVFRTCARELRLRVRCKGAIVEYSQIEFAE